MRCTKYSFSLGVVAIALDIPADGKGVKIAETLPYAEQSFRFARFSLH
jgi:hypothetical protein